MTTAITTQQLSKRYESTVALDNISLTVESGETMGFLGPNGAGKTTTLRILTGLIAPTSGSVKILGLDVETQSLDIRKRIGYLPENVSLYPEMRVQEFLVYRAKIKAVARGQLASWIDEAVSRCGLGDVRRKLIGRLSKGYRQRVGLADCLVAHPAILILDEPTVGLDPHQIRQTRDLIKDLSRNTTILLSTHILPEVEMICNRVTIINQGRIVAVDTPDNLRRRLTGSQTVRVELRADPAAIEQGLQQLRGVARVHRIGQADGFILFDVDVQGGVDIRESIFRLAVEHQWSLRQLSQTQASLEDVFIHLTTQEKEG